VVIRKYLIDLNSVGIPNILKHIGIYNVRKFLNLMENIPILKIDNNEINEDPEEKEFNE